MEDAGAEGVSAWEAEGKLQLHSHLMWLDV